MAAFNVTENGVIAINVYVKQVHSYVLLGKISP
jgi:hypothetical protein